MIKTLKKYGKYRIALYLIFVSTFAVSLSIFRIYKTDSIFYFFLNWNLFLAAVPWVLSTILIIYPGIRKRKLLLGLILGLWLLFFPNSLYIITDLFHLKKHSLAPVWYDLVLIFTFAWTGLMYGYSSLSDIESILSKHLKKRYVILNSVCLLFLASFGIYLGRFLRWNSWSIINDPFLLISDITERIIHPFVYAKTWSITILIGLMLNVVYWSIKLLSNNYKQNQIQ